MCPTIMNLPHTSAPWLTLLEILKQTQLHRAPRDFNLSLPDDDDDDFHLRSGPQLGRLPKTEHNSPANFPHLKPTRKKKRWKSKPIHPSFVYLSFSFDKNTARCPEWTLLPVPVTRHHQSPASASATTSQTKIDNACRPRCEWDCVMALFLADGFCEWVGPELDPTMARERLAMNGALEAIWQRAGQKVECQILGVCGDGVCEHE